MKPSHNTPATDIFTDVMNHVYSTSKNLKLITSINALSQSTGYKPQTILSILKQHSKLTILSCNNILAIRIKP